ncbi:MAG: hypothetical protein V3V62_02615, partial [bacterium]
RAEGRGVLRPLGVFAASAAAPVLIAFLLLRAAMPAGRAVEGVVGAWPFILGGDAAALTFYLRMFGGVDPAASLEQMLIWTGWWAAFLAPLFLLALILRRPGRRRTAITLACLIPPIVVSEVEVRWFEAARPLPIVMLASLAICFSALLRQARTGRIEPRRILQLTMFVFATVLLGKILLNVNFYLYGFALAMPAALLLAVSLLGWIPAFIERKGGHGPLFRIAALAMLMVAATAHLGREKFTINRKRFAVAGGANLIYADGRGPVVQAALGEIARRTPPGATLAVFPEGVMLNFLARRRNPTPYTNFMPPELAVYGEERILASLRAAPPDFAVIAHKDTSEYGARFFGRDYGRRLYAWIRKNYRHEALSGAPPLRDERFGIQLLRRREGVR